MFGEASHFKYKGDPRPIISQLAGFAGQTEKAYYYTVLEMGNRYGAKM